MRISQIVVGTSYSGKDGKVIRAVFSRYEADGKQLVEYTERPAGEAERPLYWRLRETHSLPLAAFARWAARPTQKGLLRSEERRGAMLRAPLQHIAGAK
jgi:hypothetical protein